MLGQVLTPGLRPGAARVFLEFLSYSSGPLPEEQFAKVQVSGAEWCTMRIILNAHMAFMKVQSLLYLRQQQPPGSSLPSVEKVVCRANLWTGAGGGGVGGGGPVGEGGVGARLLSREL